MVSKVRFVNQPKLAMPDNKTLTPAAKRALKEAKARRKEAEAMRETSAREINGPKHNPTKFGDWSKNGIVTDF